MVSDVREQDWRLEIVESDGPEGWRDVLGALSLHGSLRELRGDSDGDLVVHDPARCEHRLSLDAWSNADPDTTFLAVRPIRLRDTAIPESLEISVEELPAPSPGKERAGRQLELISVTLSDLRSAFGGDDGLIVDQYGREHPVSLQLWHAADPSTRLVVSFQFRQNVPPHSDGRIYCPDPLDGARRGSAIA
jgi:hypothetical protein